MNPALIKVFWHRTRKQPVPWTSQEVATRLNIPLDDAIDALCAHAQLGMTKAERKNRKEGASIWALTKMGEKTVAHMIKAEELIKK
jgi:hypothetical protein